MQHATQRVFGIISTFLVGSLVFQATAHAATCTPQWSSSAKTNTANLQAAIKQCAAAGNGLVDLKSNNGISTAVITSVNLDSNIVLKLERGFTLKGTTGLSPDSAVLVGKHLSNVTITGTGAIDGDGAAYWASAVGKDNTSRPKLIAISGSNIHIGSNFTDAGLPASHVTFPSESNDTGNALIIRNSPKEQLVIESGSQNVTIDGVWIYANPAKNSKGKSLAPNTDAIDIIGTNVATIQNCVLDTGDDDIAIKSNYEEAKTTDIAITHCVIGGGHGISIGGQEAAGHTMADPGVSGVTVSNILFNGTDYGYRIKTDLTQKDSGATNDVDYSDTCMANVGQPFLFTYAYASGTGGMEPVISNITIDNIIATAKTAQGAIEGVSSDLMGRPRTNDIGIRMTNTRITGGKKPFNVAYGELQLGSNSVVNTTDDKGGQVVLIKDSGPSIQCPENIAIPKQI